MRVIGILGRFLWISGVCLCLSAVSGCDRSSPGTDGSDAGPNGNDGGPNGDDGGPNGDDGGGLRSCPSEPGLCREGGACPAGLNCYGGFCLDSPPECYLPGFFFPGDADRDLEPNNCPELASPLPCGDPWGPHYDPCTCPPVPTVGGRRATHMNGMMGLGICPAGDVDTYAFYLFALEKLSIHVVYRYNLGRDVNLMILHKAQSGLYDVVAQAVSSNDNEDLDYTATTDDFYYIVVYPAHPEDVIDPNTGDILRPADLNEYILQFVLNPLGCNSNSVCDAYETVGSCPSDCTESPFCGNQLCETGETACAQDCFCGNGTCDVSAGETRGNCPDDCPQCP